MENGEPGVLRFVDLFAGIGGFHLATETLGGFKCVFASEIDKHASKVYADNFNITPYGDIREVDISQIPDFDILFAGFPCQPFSKGGSQDGFKDKVKGTLFYEILRIVESKKPKYLLLENVQNIVGHDKGRTYNTIVECLAKLGYNFPKEPLILSPHNFGVPVNRPRFFMPCIRDRRKKLEFPYPEKIKMGLDYLSEYFGFDSNLDDNLKISEYESKVLKMWDEFYRGIDKKTIGFPVWFDFFRYDGNLVDFPGWKQEFIKKNMDLYLRNQLFIDCWSEKYENLSWITNSSHRRFEWQCGTDYKSVFEGLIQFRPSGVRIKRMNMFSTLVAMNHAQIIGPLKRRLSIQETLQLQSFPPSFRMDVSKNQALKQLGNAVNVVVVKNILNWMINEKR